MTPPNGIVIQQLCERCRSALLRDELGYGPDDHWLTAEVTHNILLFQRVTARPEVWKRAEGRAENLSLVLAEYGCLRCAFPEEATKALVVLRKGISYAAQVAQGKVNDPDHIPLNPPSAS